MDLNKQTLSRLNTSFNASFAQGWKNADPKLLRVATFVPSTTRTVTYGWMQRLLKMRKWEGPRLIQNLKTHAYLLENEPFETTVGVKRRDIRDDQLGVYGNLFQEMGRVGRLLPSQQLKTVLQTGTTNLGFDNVAMFSNAHTLNPAGNQSNNFTTTALTGPNFSTVRAAMASYTGEDGEPLGVEPNLLIVPPQLMDTANTIVTAEFGSSGASNVQKDQASVLVVPELANEPTTWYLGDVTGAIKGLIWQEREAVKLVPKTAPTDDNVFWENEFFWGMDGEGVAGYGPWFLLSRAIA